MKYKVNSIFLCVACLFVLGACSSHKNRDYVLDKVCDTEPRFRITKITITDKDTRVNCRYFYKALGKEAQNPGGEALGVAPPGHPAAISIIADSGKKYNLLKVTGIPTLPDTVHPQDGDVLDIQLVFERIDDSVKKINILEGNAGMSITWQFLNIQLP